MRNRIYVYKSTSGKPGIWATCGTNDKYLKRISLTNSLGAIKKSADHKIFYIGPPQSTKYCLKQYLVKKLNFFS